MTLLDKFLNVLSLDDNHMVTENRMAQYAAEYVLNLRSLIMDFDITDRFSDLPLEVSRVEPADRFWLKQLRDDIDSYRGVMEPRFWWNRKRVSFHFQDLAELPERQVLQLNLADDLVMLFSELRQITLRKCHAAFYTIDVDKWHHAEYNKILERGKNENSPSLQALWAGVRAFDKMGLEIQQLYDSVYTPLRALTETFIDTVVRDPEDKEDLKRIFELPENESLLTKYADLRAKVLPCRLMLDGSYPGAIRNVLRNLEVRNSKHNTLFLLEKEIAKAYQRMNAAMEIASGRDD